MSEHVADPKKPFHLFYIGQVSSPGPFGGLGSSMEFTEQALVFHQSCETDVEAKEIIDGREDGRVWFILNSYPQAALAVDWRRS